MRGTRDAILKAAMRIFAENGYEGSSIRRICEGAGVTKPVLYYHFRSKEHLYQELMLDSFGHYLKILLQASKTRGTLRQRLTRIVYNDFRIAKSDPTRVRFMMRMVFAPDAQRPFFNWLQEMEKQREVIAGVLREGIDGGEARGDAHRLATALMGMNLIAVLENIFTGNSVLTRRSAELYVDILLQNCSVQ